MGDITSTYKINYTLTGLINSGDEIIGLPNGSSPGEVQVFTLLDSGGLILLTPATRSGGTQTGVILIPPKNNIREVKLKGTQFDPDGILMHKTNPMYLSLEPTVASIYLAITPGTGNLTGYRAIWL